MAVDKKTLKNILEALGVSDPDSYLGNQQQMNRAISAINNSTSSSSSSSSGSSGGSSTGSALGSTIRQVNDYIKALDQGSYATVKWNQNILDLGADIADLSGAILSMDLGKMFTEFKDILSPFIELDQALRNAINKELGVTGFLARDIRQSVIETAESTTKYGIEVSSITDMYTSMYNTLGRLAPVSEDIMVNTAKWARASGVSLSNAGDFLGKLENFGLSMYQGPELLEEMSGTARSMGLTTNKFMSYAAENLKMINTLGFDKGVRGFTEIAAKASAIGFNLSTAAASAEKLFDIDSAVEMAAQLNVLGGDFGRLGNAIDLMFMPTNDMEGFTNELMNATKQFVTFNAEKNTFDVSPLDLRRAREFAKATGMSLEEVIESGKRLSKMEVIKDQISFIPNLTEEERNLIGSLGQLNASGQVTIKGKTVTELSNAGELGDAIRSLKQEDKRGKMTQNEILNEQLNMFTKMNFYLKGIALQVAGFGKEAGVFSIVGDDLNDLIYSITGGEDENLMNEILSRISKGQGIDSALDGYEIDAEKRGEIDAQINAINAKFRSFQGTIKANMPDALRNNRGAGIDETINLSNNVSNNINITMDGITYALDPDDIKTIKSLTQEYKMRVTNNTSSNVTSS